MKICLRFAGSALVLGLVVALGHAVADEYLNGIEWKEPAIVTPGSNGSAPSDAVVLFDGKDFSAWDGVFNFGAGDIIEVNLEFEKGKRMYPFSDEVVPEVNIEEGFLVIDREAFEGEPNEGETGEQKKG